MPAQPRRSSVAAAPDPGTAYHHGDLRNALIAAGRQALEEIGPQELSLRHVARTVGVSATAPARHFDGKQGLLAAIAADGFRELAAQRMKVAKSAIGSYDKAYRMMDLYVDFARRHKGLFNLMVGPRIMKRDDYDELLDATHRSFRLFELSVCDVAIESGWPNDALAHVTYAAWGLEHGLANLLLADRIPRPDIPIEFEPMIRFSISLLLSGITAGPGSLAGVTSLLSPPARRRPRRATP